MCLAGVAAIFFIHQHRGPAGLAAGRLHRLLRVFAGRGDLGLSQRSLSQPRARQGPEPGQLHALDHECAHLRHLPASWPHLPEARPFVFFAAMMVVQFFVVLVRLPGDQGNLARSRCRRSWESPKTEQGVLAIINPNYAQSLNGSGSDVRSRYQRDPRRGSVAVFSGELTAATGRLGVPIHGPYHQSEINRSNC